MTVKFHLVQRKIDMPVLVKVIYEENFDSLLYLLNKCKELDIPAVLETNGYDMLALGQLSELKMMR